MATTSVDVTASLRSACTRLQPGQMLHVPGLTLMDAMAAIQIMDPRMDGGIDPVPVELLAPCDRVSEGTPMRAFDVCAPLTAEDVLWIMDRMMACEASWLASESLSGASLAQTIHTCLYMHELASMHPNAPTDVDAAQATTAPPLAQHVLRPYIIGVLKGVGLIWDELTKGNLIDGEDFNGDKAGVGLMEGFHPQGAEDLIEDALHWLQRRTDFTSDEKAALSARLSMRKHFLAIIALFSHIDPTLHFAHVADVPQSLRLAQERMSLLRGAMQHVFWSTTRSFASPSLASAPSAVARAAFDPWLSRHTSASKTTHTPMSLPPPQPVQLGARHDVHQTYVHVIDGMQIFTELAAGPLNGWRRWKHFFDHKAITFQQRQSAPYVRSLWQSAVCSDTTVSLDKPLSYIAESFLLDMAGIQPGSLPKALWQAFRGAHGHEPVSGLPVDRMLALEKRLGYFTERLAGQLVAHVRNLAQNRSRSKRRLAHSYADLLALSDEALALGMDVSEAIGGVKNDTLHPELLFAAVQALALDTMLHGILAGFELDVYRTQECAGAYWMAHKAAEERCSVLDGLLGWVMLLSSRSSGQEPTPRQLDATIAFLRAQVLWTTAVGRASLALFMLYEHDQALAAPAAPWTKIAEAVSYESNGSSTPSIARQAAQTIFHKRFKWLRIAARPETDGQLDSLWHALNDEAQSIRQLGTAGRLADAATLLKKAAADCLILAEHRDRHDDGSRQDCSRQLAQTFTSIALAAQRAVQESSASSDDECSLAASGCLLPLHFPVQLAGETQEQKQHPWFPTLRPST